MNPVLHAQHCLISQIQTFITKMDDRFVSQTINKEFFYLAANELNNHIPTQQISSSKLANKILSQVAPHTDYEQIVDQLNHRIKIFKEKDHHHLDQITLKFQKDKEKMKECGAKVKDFQQLYEEQLKNLQQSPNDLGKKTIAYFQSSNKEWPLEEMLSHLIEELSPHSQQQSNEEGELDEQPKLQMDRLIEQLRQTEITFQF